MVADEPLPDRCGARITDKVGLEIELDDSTLTDRHVDAVRLQSPDSVVTVVAEADYQSVREYLWDDHEVTAIGIDAETDLAIDAPSAPTIEADTTAGSPPSNLTWIDVSDAVNNVTNARAAFQGYCERYPMHDDPHDRCYVHQAGSGAPEGNVNGMTHGLYAQRTAFYDALDDEDKQFVEAMVDSWVEMAPYDRTNVAMINELYRLAIDQLKAWAGIDEYVEDDGTIVGLVTEQDVVTDDGIAEIEDEHPVNMPYSRLDRDIRSKLKDHGIYQDAEMQQAEATESLAQKLSGLSED